MTDLEENRMVLLYNRDWLAGVGLQGVGFHRGWLTSAELAAGIFLLLTLLASPTLLSVSAQDRPIGQPPPPPINVFGFISDENGVVDGASVTVMSPAGQKGATSNSDGFYYVENLPVMGLDDTITVQATKGFKSGSNSRIVEPPSMQINVFISGPDIVTKTVTATSYVVIHVIDAVVTSTMTPLHTVYVTAGTETVVSTVTTAQNTVESTAQSETHTVTEWVNLSETRTLVLTEVRTIAVLPVTETVSLTTTNTVRDTVTETVAVTSSGSPTLVQWTFLLSLAAIALLAAAVLIILAPNLRRVLRQLASAVRQLISKAGISLALCVFLAVFSFLALASLPGISAEGQTSTVTSTKIVRITTTSHVTSILWRTVTSTMTVPLAETVYSTSTTTSRTTFTEVYKTTVFTTKTQTSLVTVTVTSWRSVTSFSTLSSSSH